MFRLYYFLQIPEKNTKSQIWEKWFMVIHIFEARIFCKNNHIFFHLTQIMFRALSEHFQNIHIQNIKQWWTDNTLEKFILIIHSSPKVSIEAHYEYYHIFVVVTNDAIHNIKVFYILPQNGLIPISAPKNEGSRNWEIWAGDLCAYPADCVYLLFILCIIKSIYSYTINTVLIMLML